MQIHNFEVDELVKDLKNGYIAAKPVCANVINYLKESYKKAFSTIENATTDTKEEALE